MEINLYFSKPCHLVGGVVLDHLPFEEVNSYFSLKPPQEWWNMCRTFGRGILCDIFQFGPIFDIVSLSSWKSIDEGPAQDSDVCELIRTELRLGIGYGNSGYYYMLDFNNKTFTSSVGLEKILETAANHRELGGVIKFPFFITVKASRHYFYVHLGDRFYEKSCEAEVPGLAIHHYFNYHGTNTLFFDKHDRFVATLLTGEGVSPEGHSLLVVSFDEEQHQFIPEHIFHILTDISEGAFQIIRRHF